MPFLDSSQVEALAINRMVCHVVGGHEPVLLREIGVSSIGGFFVDRIVSGNTGILLDFEERSGTAAALRRIRRYDNRFNRESKWLARLFHKQHTGKTSEGLFMLFDLSCKDESLFAILKYDQQEVVRFAIREDAKGRKRVTLRTLENALVKAPEALQKSAIIRLSQDGGEVCVRDRSADGSITRYFQRFLGARRRYSNGALTALLQAATQKAAKECLDDIPPQIRKNINQRIDDALRSGGHFDPDHVAGYLGAVFGALPDSSAIPTAFVRQLKRSRIEGESFPLDASEIPRPPRRRLTTVEGITVTYEQQYSTRVAVEEGAAGGYRITINTGGVREDDLSE